MDVSFLTAHQHDLRLPKPAKDKALAAWVSSQPIGQHRPIEDAPFRKMYDFWFASILWAEHHDLSPAEGASTEKFISAGPTSADARLETWVLELLLLIAVRRLKPDVDTLPEAKQVFKLANNLAAVGASRLLDELDRRSDLMEPRLYTTVEMFREAAAAGKDLPRARR